jgi:hypothetical protein
MQSEAIQGIQMSARLIFGLCSLGLVSIIMIMIRRNAIREKYALLWLPLGVGLLALSVFPEILVMFSARVHLHYMTVVVMGVIFLFTNILLYFTVRISQLREDVKKLSQEIALSRAREGQAAAGRDSAETGAKARSGKVGSAEESAGWLPASGNERAGGPD